MTTRPPLSSAASSSIPCARPRRSSSASRPSSPSSESRIDRRPQSCGVLGRPDDRDACGARADAVGGVRGVDAPDRDHRNGDRSADLAQAVEPRGRVGVLLRRGRPDRACADVAGTAALGVARLLGGGCGEAEQSPSPSARSAPLSLRPRWTPSAPSRTAASTSSLTTKVAPSSRNGAPRATSSSVPAPFRRSCTTVAPPATAARAVSTSSTSTCSFTRPSPACRACPDRERRARRRARRGSCPGLWPSLRLPRRRRRTRRAPRPPPRADRRAERPESTR